MEDMGIQLAAWRQTQPSQLRPLPGQPADTAARKRCQLLCGTEFWSCLLCSIWWTADWHSVLRRFLAWELHGGRAHASNAFAL